MPFGSLLSAEVFPSAYGEVVEYPIGVANGNTGSPRSHADIGERNSGDLRRDALRGGRGEEKLVIFAAVECEFERNFAARPADASTGNPFGHDFRADSALLADVGKVGGEPVAGVNHGAHEALFAESAAEGDARLGIEVARIGAGSRFWVGRFLKIGRVKIPTQSHRTRQGWGTVGCVSSRPDARHARSLGPLVKARSFGMTHSPLEMLEFHYCGGGTAQLPADVDAIARMCPGAQDGFAFGHGAEEDDIGEDSVRRFGGVASSQRDLMAFRKIDQASREATHPGLRQIAGKSEG